ncbi:MAG: MATE family efflux transporter [Deltaproteobacteria bacterium]|nr:MATE family efflux transporter [Deltaproteobacteria bacterium]
MAASSESPLRREVGALLRLALPIAAAQAGQTSMGLVDVAVVGTLGARPLGAIGLATSTFFFVAVLGLGAVMGLDPLVSQALGAGEKPRARKLLWQGVWLALAAAIVLDLLLLGAPALMQAMKVPVETGALTLTCLRWRMLSMPALLVFAAVRAFLQAHGVTRPMVISTIACNILNLGLDLVLVRGGERLPAWAGPLRHVPAFGAPGAAIATTIGTLLQLGIVAYAAANLQDGPMEKTARRPVAEDLRRALRVGLPIGLQMAAEVGVFALVTLLAARLGDASLAAHNLALNLASFSFSVAIGVGNAGSVRVGRAVGQRDQHGVRRSGLVAFGCGAVVMATGAVTFLLAPHWLPRFYGDHPDVLAVAVPLLFVAGFFQLSDGVQGVGAGVLRGAGDTVFPFVANVVGHYGVGFPVAFTLGIWLGHGITGLWWGLACGLTAVALALFSRFLWLSARPIVPLDERTPKAESPVDVASTEAA